MIDKVNQKDQIGIKNLTPKEITYALARAEGLTQAEAGRKVGIKHKQSAHNMEKRIKAKSKALTYEALGSSFFDKRVRKVFKHTLDGTKWGEHEKPPNITEAVALAKWMYEQRNPKVTRVEMKHSSLLSPQVVDVTPTEEVEEDV